MAAKSSKTVQIASVQQFNTVLAGSKAVVADFYADWCGPCKAIAPIYEDFSSTYSRKDQVTFVKINTDNLQDLSARFSVTALPTFIYFENGKENTRVQGGDKAGLTRIMDSIKKILAGGGGDAGEGSSSGDGWSGASLPRGMKDVTDQIDIKGLEILNLDTAFGVPRAIFEPAAPSTLNKGKGKSSTAGGEIKDWIESDADDQLMIHVPFQSVLKVHSLHITSLPPDADDDDEIPTRPAALKLYINSPTTVGFDEDRPIVQEFDLKEEDWDSKNGTINIPLRYVNFQKVSSLDIKVDSSYGDSERVRIDRIRVIGDSGEKRDLGKLEKIGDEQGE